MKYAVAFALMVLATMPAAGQVHGTVAVMLDVVPDPDDAPDRQSVSELRTRAHAEWSKNIGNDLYVFLGGYVEGLIADRNSSSTVTAAVAGPTDLFIETRDPRYEIRAGAGRIIWGRLDEFQPTDVVNPLDLRTFLLQGRSDARLPVGFVRGRWLISEAASLEGIVVPVFRRAVFDQLDEETSPFNVGLGSVVSGFSRTIMRDEPNVGWKNLQGGARFAATTSRVDWSAVVYRGFRSFPVVTARQTALGARLNETFPRFTMVGGDFETVNGQWGIRGEVAAFVDDTLQAATAPIGVDGRSFDAGIGVDRRAGNYRVAGDVLWAWRSATAAAPVPDVDEGVHDSEVTLVMAVDRSFAQMRRSVRLFGVYNPADGTAFGRAIASIALTNNTALEASGGVFTGSAAGLLGRLSRRDFLYARLSYLF